MPFWVSILSGGCYAGWNIGANDTANSVGAGLLSFRRAVILVALFVISRALLEGEAVMKTTGGGVVKTDLPPAAVITMLLEIAF